jgi:hypothetical protein
MQYQVEAGQRAGLFRLIQAAEAKAAKERMERKESGKFSL